MYCPLFVILDRTTCLLINKQHEEEKSFVHIYSLFLLCPQSCISTRDNQPLKQIHKFLSTREREREK
jgi:hypothetical protein